MFTEKQAATLLEKVEGLVEFGADVKTVKEKLQALSTEFEELKGLNLDKIREEYDALKAQHEQVQKSIRTSKGGLYVPGIEDQQFSMVKAMTAIARKDWTGAEHEKEIMDSVRAKASQAVGDDSRGGYFVPDQVIPDLIEAIYTASAFVNLGGFADSQTRISVLDGLVGGNIKIPKFNGGTIAYWLGEEDAYVESNVTVGDVHMNPKKLGVLVKLTDTMMRLGGSAFGFERLLRNDMVRAAATKIDHTVMFGRGTDDMPKGITQWDGIKIYSAEADNFVTAHDQQGTLQADWAGAELTYDGLDNMLLALEEDDITLDESAEWISSPRYFKRLKQLKIENYATQTTGQPYLLGIPMIPDNRLADIIGPFGKSNQIPSNALPGAATDAPTTSVNAKFTTVFGGNLSDVVLGRWSGIEIVDDGGIGSGFVTDHTFLKLRLYLDLVVRQPRSLIVCPDAKTRD